MAANAFPIARSTAGESVSARISTIVPRIGLARRILFERDVIKRQKALHAVGDMPTRQRGAADVLDVAVEGERCATLLPNELPAPFRIADLVAVALPVFHDLDAAHHAIASERGGVCDVFMLADHFVDDEELAA